jgi:hypothetical protein
VDERDPGRPEATAPAGGGLTTATLAGAGPAAAEAAEEKRGDRRAAATAPPQHGAKAEAERSEPLFSADETGRLRSRWDEIQAGFVDEPRRAVEQADQAVAEAMKRLAEMFAAERSNLEGQWDRGGDVSTEDLRLALRRYRSFFGRLLSV